MAELVNLLTRVLTTPAKYSNGVTRAAGANPFASSSGNPFVTPHNSNSFANYG